MDSWFDFLTLLMIWIIALHNFTDNFCTSTDDGRPVTSGAQGRRGPLEKFSPLWKNVFGIVSSYCT